MRNTSSDNDANKEFHYRPTIRGNKTAAGNLPNVELYDNSTLNEQKIQKKRKITRAIKAYELDVSLGCIC